MKKNLLVALLPAALLALSGTAWADNHSTAALAGMPAASTYVGIGTPIGAEDVVHAALTSAPTATQAQEDHDMEQAYHQQQDSQYGGHWPNSY